MSAWRSLRRGTAWALRILRTPFSKYVPIEQELRERLTDMAEVCPDKPSLPEEMLDDLPSLVAYRAEREAQGKTRPVQIRKAG